MNNPMYCIERFTSLCESIVSISTWKTCTLIGAALALTGNSVFAAPPSADLDQVRNGPAAAPYDPVDWVNGNAGGSNSHYLEGYSIPYRAVMENLPVDNGTTIIKLTLAYDATHSGRHALDFLTHYDRLDNPDHDSIFYFGHPPEPINPIDDLSGVDLKSVDENNYDLDDLTLPDTVAIPTPIALPPDLEATLVAAFNKLPAPERLLTLYGGTFVTEHMGKSYPAYVKPDGTESRPDIADGQSEQMITILFTANSPTAVLAWGGHIASRYDWGYDEEGKANSAGALSGSPYHMRTIDWNLNNLGNQDRSLSADAVLTLEECELIGERDICYAQGPHTYSVDTQSTKILWEIDHVLSSYKFATASGPYDQPSFTFDTPIPGEGMIVLRVTVDIGEITQNTCEYMITVHTPPVCTITEEQTVQKYIGNTEYSFSGPEGMQYYTWSLTNDSEASIVSGADARTVTILTDDFEEGDFELILIIEDEFGCNNIDECSTSKRDFQEGNPPNITCPGDVNVECDVLLIPENTGGYPIVTDDFDPNPTVTYTDVVVGVAACGFDIIERTWTATDNVGNVATCVQTITIVDTTPPEITCPPDLIIDCLASTDPSSTGSASANDNCSGVAISYNDVVNQPNLNCADLTITRTWTAIDDCGNSSSCDQIITVVDNTPPVIECPADATIDCTASTDPSNTGSATATDDCSGVTVTYSDLVSQPDPTCADLTITRTWTATDGCGNASTCDQIITVGDNTPPTLTCPDDVTIDCLDSTAPSNTGSATAVDDCSGATVTYSDSVNQPDPNCADLTITRTWTATDGCGNASSCDQIITVVDTTPPAIACPADVTIDCTASTDPSNTGSATATDDCSGATVTYSDSIDQPDPTCADLTITRTWTAIDGCGNASSCVQIITVVDNTPPVITCPDDATIDCTASTDPSNTGSATATDDCSGATISYSDAVDQPNPNCAELTITRTWTAIDGCGNASSCVQIITVVDTTPPVINCPADVEIDCTASTDPSNTGSATATDDCSGATVTYNDVVDQPDPNCASLTITRTWTAIDGCGNSSSCVQVITVVDNTPPAITCPPDVTIDCLDTIDPSFAGTATAIDDCSGATVTYRDVVDQPDPDCANKTITRTWTAIDGCGNSSSCVQTIRVEDTTGPVVTAPNDVTVECSDSKDPSSTGRGTAIDDCSTVASISFSDAITAGNCIGNYTITRTWTAVDACGNSGSDVQVITVQDTTGPVVTAPNNISVECDESTAPGNTGTASATDACGNVASLDYSDVVTPGLCPNESTITRTWTAVDDCGNSSSAVQTITVEDTTPPTVIPPANQVFPCGLCPDTIPDPNDYDRTNLDFWPVVSDNCDDGPFDITWDDQYIYLKDCDGNDLTEQCPQGIRRIWKVTDCAENDGYAVQYFTCLSENEVTDSSLCIFDRDSCIDNGQDFRIVFTPDTENKPYHMISSTNPGQFFYNVFKFGEPGTPVTIRMFIPYPYVTKGANPIHIYDSVGLEQCGDSVGFIPGNVIQIDSSQIELDNDDYLNDPNCDGQGTYVDVSFILPEEVNPITGLSFAYVNIHLEYGLVHMGDFAEALGKNATLKGFESNHPPVIAVKNNCEHLFAYTEDLTITSPVDLDGILILLPVKVSSAINTNQFQASAGIMGRVTVFVGGIEQAVPNADVYLADEITGDIINDDRKLYELSVKTDDQGYYFIPHVHQGRPTVHYVTVDSGEGTKTEGVLVKNKGLSELNFKFGSPSP